MKSIALIAICLFGISQSPAFASPIAAKAPCRLEVDNAHISSTLIKKINKKAVKVNFKSICNFGLSNLVIKVQIRKLAFIGDRPVTAISVRTFPYVPAKRQVLIQDIYAFCKNTKRTLFLGTAEAYALLSGTQVQAPRAQSREIVPLACGT